MLFCDNDTLVLHPMWKQSRGHPKPAEKVVNEKLLMSFMAIIYMMYATFATSFFGLFSCAGYPGESSRRLRKALDTKCFEGEHLQWVCIFDYWCFYSVYSVFSVFFSTLLGVSLSLMHYLLLWAVRWTAISHKREKITEWIIFVNSRWVVSYNNI